MTVEDSKLRVEGSRGWTLTSGTISGKKRDEESRIARF